MSSSYAAPLLFCLLLSAPTFSGQNTPPPDDVPYAPSLQELLASPQPIEHITKPEVSTDLQKLAESLQSSRWHKFPSGVGAIAVGRAAYSTYQNPTATRISKRLAYLDAYMNAKINLANLLKGSFIQAEQSGYRDLLAASTGAEDVGNSVVQFRERYTQTIESILRGFVVFDVEDDDHGNVRVSIFSTPRTRSAFCHTTENVLCADAFSDGIAVLMNDLRRGVAPPVGGKIVTVPGTGEIALVGYGTAVIRYSNEPALQSTMRTAAERTAALRARTSLLALLKGESFAWTLTTSESTSQYIQQFERIEDPEVLKKATQIQEKSPLQRMGTAAADVTESLANAVTRKPTDNQQRSAELPLSAAEIENALFTPPSSSIAVFDQARRYIQSDLRSTETFKTAINGNLPPGVLPMTWIDDEGGTAYCVAVFTARSSDLAKRAATEMAQGGFLPGTSTTGKRPLDPSIGFKADAPENQPSRNVRQGPTGQVTDERDG